MRINRIQAAIIAGLLSLLRTPQLATAQPILNVAHTPVDGEPFVITWTRDPLESDSRVSHGTTTALGLTPDTKYYFEVRSVAARSPVNADEYYSFTTTTDPVTEHSISPVPRFGVYGALIEARVVVEEKGTYYICWGSRSSENRRAIIHADEEGSFTAHFTVPKAAKGEHTVYLTDDKYGELASTEFEVDPTVRIDPVRGSVGREAGVTGHSFTAGEDAQLIFGEEVIKTVKAGGDYIFSVPILEVPPLWAYCNMRFTVTPEISVDQDWDMVGQLIDVKGTGFDRNKKGIAVTFKGKVVEKDISADEAGSWSAKIAVPTRLRGTYVIDASGSSTKARDVADVDFTVVTGVWVEPSSSQVGDRITVTGGAFVPGEQGTTVTFEDLPTPQSVSPQDGRRLRSGQVTFEWGKVTVGSDIIYTLEASD